MPSNDLPMDRRTKAMPALSRTALTLRVLGFVLLLGLAFAYFKALNFDLERVLDEARDLPPSAFVLAMSLLPVIGFPIAAFYLFAGVAFGFWTGWGLCLIAMSLNMSLSYLVARFFLRAPLLRLLARWGQTIPALSEVNTLRFIFLLRTVPGPPYAVQNYLLSLMDIPFRTYLSVSLLTQGIIAGAVVAGGGLLTEKLEPRHAFVALALLAALVGMKLFLRFRRKTGSQSLN
jgi:uncharacterized membrane protein YdjX (TVP38/TMEM64 family)